VNAPTQVWAPLFEISPYDGELSRDLDRAKSEWRGEDRLWLCPDAKEVARWSQDPSFRECLIPSEYFNRIDVYNVDEGRRIYPVLSSSGRLRKGIPEGFHREWVRAKPGLYTAARSELFSVPRMVDGRVVYEERRFRLEPGSIIPTVAVDQEHGLVIAAWPPQGRASAEVISPEMEGKSLYGPLKREAVSVNGKDAEAVVAAKDSTMRALHASLKWPKPYNRLFPTGGGVDLLYHQMCIHRCIREWGEGKKDRVLREVENCVNRLTDDIEVPLGRIWFSPKSQSESDARIALYEFFHTYGINAQKLEDLEKSENFEELMQQKIRVRRVFGWLGYFWWRLHEDLKADLMVRLCERCGSVISGGHCDRRFCTPAENPPCFRARNSASQRKSRLRQLQPRKDRVPK